MLLKFKKDQGLYKQYIELLSMGERKEGRERGRERDREIETERD